MGQNSRIEWTDNTWNPWYGCHKVSNGCKNCYMFRERKHYGQDPTIVQRSKTTFRDPLSWARQARRLGARYRVFTCSWSDFFIEEADPWRADAWDIIRQTPELIYLVLTKRPELILERLPADWGAGWKHVWLGVSCEDQKTADKRIPLLLGTPAAIRFVSCEPLLGEIRLHNIPYGNQGWKMDALQGIHWGYLDYQHGCSKLNWVIAGGESGTLARPPHPDWVRQLRDQCIEANIPFFFKQWGEYAPLELPPDERAAGDVTYLWMGRKLAGALIDGVEWRQVPEYQ
jgi:protein gp37